VKDPVGGFSVFGVAPTTAQTFFFSISSIFF
jgi:hypothetical protein